MTNVRPCRLAVLAPHPIQYFTPLYKRLAAMPGLDLSVFFCGDFGVRPRFDEQFGQKITWDTDQLSGYRHRFLLNVSPVRNSFNPLHAINPGAFFRMLAGFEALWVHGYLYPSNWLAVAAGRLRGTKLLFRSELDGSERSRSWPHRTVRDALLRRWIGSSDALLYVGRANREAYKRYGARESQLFFTPYSVDVDSIGAAAPPDGSRKPAVREEFGIPANAQVALFSGKLTRNKHPEALLRLCASAPAHLRLHAVFAGSGEMEQSLRDDAARLGNRGVTFLGFVNQSRMADVYAAADVLVLPSEREQWGLVVNEAMAAGVPAVISDSVGSAPDLITEGVTGFTFPAGDWAEMSRRAVQLLEDDPLRGRVGEAARSRANEYSYDASARGVVRALTALGVYTPTADAALGSGVRSVG